MTHNNRCYKSPFLKEVIFRIDFASPLTTIGEVVPRSLTREILGRFPILEPRTTQTQEFQFTGRDFQAKTTERPEWHYHGKEREKTLILCETAIIFVVKKYTSYESLSDDILNILNVFFSEFHDAQASKVGLRYINVIELNDGQPLAWQAYINERILGIIDLQSEAQYLTRIFHIVEYNFGAYALKYQFGIANPDYPAVIRKKQFVLDLDAFSQGLFTYSEVMPWIEIAHQKIQDIFEQSITEALRELMDPQLPAIQA